VANDAGANYLYRGNGKGNFSDAGFTSGVTYNENGVAQANMGIAIGDYLHTGRLSVLLTHFNIEHAALYRNDGQMSFTDVFYGGEAAGKQLNSTRRAACIRPKTPQSSASSSQRRRRESRRRNQRSCRRI